MKVVWYFKTSLEIFFVAMVLLHITIRINWSMLTEWRKCLFFFVLTFIKMEPGFIYSFISLYWSVLKIMLHRYLMQIKMPLIVNPLWYNCYYVTNGVKREIVFEIRNCNAKETFLTSWAMAAVKTVCAEIYFNSSFLN